MDEEIPAARNHGDGEGSPRAESWRFFDHTLEHKPIRTNPRMRV